MKAIISSARIRGSALMMSLIMIGVLIALGAASFMTINNRYRVVHQAASWQEALLTAEAGVDLALTEIRKELWDPSNAWQGWSTASDLVIPDPSLGPVYRTSEALLREGEGGTRSHAVVTVDGPAALRDRTGEQWYRIRSRGICDIPGSAIAAGAPQDLRLRKLSLRWDHRTHTQLAHPQAARMIEAIAKPQGAIRAAVFGTGSIDMTNNNIVIDSYDSRDPNKSTNGKYDPAERQWNGDIATNGQVINAGLATIYGSASTNGGDVVNNTNVKGNFEGDPDRIRTDYFQETINITAPTVTPSLGTPSQILNKSEVIQAQPGTPTQVVLSSITLSGQEIVRIQGIPGVETFCQIIVTGNMTMTGQSKLVIDPGVHVRIFAKGDVDLVGGGVTNPGSPLNFQVYGCDRPPNADGTPALPGNMKIGGNGGFNGSVYAPNYNLELVGGGVADTVSGGFAGKRVLMNGVQSIHYDEALGDGGLITGYNIVSWFEDER
jgi:hypothetical protein